MTTTQDDRRPDAGRPIEIPFGWDQTFLLTGPADRQKFDAFPSTKA